VGSAHQPAGQQKAPQVWLDTATTTFIWLDYFCIAVVVLLVAFQVADALQQPFPDNSFDLVWSMVSWDPGGCGCILQQLGAVQLLNASGLPGFVVLFAKFATGW
jgi:hypothetical protein